MPLPFNKALDLKLLALVKENPIIYNTKHAKYLDFDSREVIWQKIGDALGRPAQICKTRWVNIRDMMRRKVRERLKNPNPNKNYTYKYEEELTFMLPYFKEINLNPPNEEYSDYFEESNCTTELADPFENTEEYHHEAKEIKPSIGFQKRMDPNSSDFQELNPTDPLDVFLITIGSTLRKFSPYYLNQAKSKIFQVVQDYELQQIVNKDDQPGSSSSDTKR